MEARCTSCPWTVAAIGAVGAVSPSSSVALFLDLTPNCDLIGGLHRSIRGNVDLEVTFKGPTPKNYDSINVYRIIRRNKRGKRF